MSSNNVILYGRWEQPRTSGLFGRTWGETIFAGLWIVTTVLFYMFTHSLILIMVFFLVGATVFIPLIIRRRGCLLYTSAAADERSRVDLGGRRIIKKKKIKIYTLWGGCR